MICKLWAKMLPANQIAGFFEVCNIIMQYFKNEVRDKFHFLHEDEHESFPQPDNTIAGFRSKSCPKYPK